MQKLRASDYKDYLQIVNCNFNIQINRHGLSVQHRGFEPILFHRIYCRPIAFRTCPTNNAYLLAFSVFIDNKCDENRSLVIGPPFFGQLGKGRMNEDWC